MKRANVPLSLVGYSVMVKACGQAKDLDAAIRTFEDMQANGLMPNLFTYTCVVQACCQNRNTQKALFFFEQMKKDGLAADEVAYGTLINGMIFGGRLEDALRLVEEALGS